MKKMYIVLIAIVGILILFIGIFLYERTHASLYMDESGTSVSIIGGADGPTSVFIAGKVGDNTDINEKVVLEIEKMQIEIQIGDASMLAELYSNDTTEELVGLLEEKDLVMSASNYGGFEKVCSIGQSLTRNDTQISTEPGDIMLYSGNQMVIFYDTNSWAYTPIGHIDATQNELKTFLSGSETEVTVRLVKEYL